MIGIKFRAWDIEDKVMMPVGRIDFGLDDEFGERVWLTDGGANCYWIFNRDSPGSEEFELLQYTGLKDKTGKEIYEGDIVKCYQGGVMTADVVMKISFYEAAFMLTNEANHVPLGAFPEEDLAIIGNIYENPELLGFDIVKA